MRIAVGELAQESCTFQPQLTDASRFQRYLWSFGDDLLQVARESRLELGGVARGLSEQSASMVGLFGAKAWPWGPLRSETRAELEDTLLSRLRTAGEVDGVLLILHGGLVAEDEDDVEGSVLAGVRDVVGNSVPIVATLDSHAWITERMVANAQALITYSTVPHTDQYQTGHRAAELLTATIAGRHVPVMGWRRIPMITPAETHQTAVPPMSALMDIKRSIEAEQDVLVCSLAHVQPWLDVPGLGWSTVAVIDRAGRSDDKAVKLARDHADRLAQAAWMARHDFLVEKVAPNDAVAYCTRADGPIVVSDSGDNTGGGGTGDSTVLLDAVLKAKPQPRALLTLTDPAATLEAVEAGPGAGIDMWAGASVDAISSRPVRIEGHVRALPDGRVTIAGPSWTGAVQDLGHVAVIDVARSTLVLTEHPLYNIDPAIFRQLGIEPTEYALIQTKSPCGFRAGYRDIARDVLLMQSPGYTTSEFAQLPWKRVTRPLFPLGDFGPARTG